MTERPSGQEAVSLQEDCLFCKMMSGQMKADALYDDDEVFVIRDINPRAPVHLLVIPKEHIPDARHVGREHGPTLARMMQVSHEMAQKERVDHRGYRLALNVGDDAGMTISHLHMHLVGGRRLGAEG